MATVEQSAPPLQAGDCLSPEKFMRRWEAQPEIKFAELIGGVVYMPSPRPFEHAGSDCKVPPLEFGDSLSLDEFIRRWEAHPEIKFAELIGGMVYMPSPLAFEHGMNESDVGTWLGVYKAFTPGTAASKNATTYLLGNAPQPDSSLLILPEFGGRTRRVYKYIGG